MTDILKLWKIDDYPNVNVPSYNHAFPIGPDFAVAYFENLKFDNLVYEGYDFVFKTFGYTRPSRLELQSGDSIFVLYHNVSQWLYAITTDLEWAVMLSNTSENLPLKQFELEAAQESFVSSFDNRTVCLTEYYDKRLLETWTRIWQVGS